MIIGRKEEQQSLLDAYKSEYSSFVAVYGRRRIGKTFLIRETFDYKFTFHHSGLANGTKKEQISEFCASLYKAGYKEIGEKKFKCPKDWFGAFFLLEQFIKSLPKGKSNEKKIIFLDELSWMDTHKSRFITALESFWNGWASARKDILLIVCASATSWMIDKVIHNKGGLYNRLNARIRLDQFTLSECKEYIRSKNIVMNNHQLLECYMIMGGVPYYWSLLEKEFSLPQNIDRIFFSSKAPLKDEFKYLYQALFNSPEKYIVLITAFGKKKAGLKRDELLKIAKLPDSGDITKKLEDLESSGFIKKYREYGKKTRDSLYQLVDNFTLFYFKFIEQGANDEHFWENNFDSPPLNAWRGLAFERVCFEHIPQIKKKLGISGVSTYVCSWSCKANPDEGFFGSQIDLLIDRKDQIVNICEMKYASNEYTVTKKDDESLRRKTSDFRLATKTKSAIHHTVITTYGLTENSYAGDVQSVVNADDLCER